MAGVWILSSLSCFWIQDIIGSCSRGTFGDSCSYTCHCGQSCNLTTGVCGGACDTGWVGGNGGICQKENVALGKNASSPTRLWSLAWSADKAVDGNSNQDVYQGSCFLSADNVRSLWTVDLRDDYRIHDVRIYHQKNHLTRIRTAALYLSNTSTTPSVPCYTFPSNTSVTGNGIYNVVCDGIGRYFTITDPTHLNLCEVEIYVCSPGVFGDSCNQFCHCFQATCDPVKGVCPGDCRPGWQGDRCDTECDADHYGVNCVNICRDRKCSDVNPSCDRYTGSCNRGCLPGWRGVDCTEEEAGSVQAAGNNAGQLAVAVVLAFVAGVAVGVIVSVVVWRRWNRRLHKTSHTANVSNAQTERSQAGDDVGLQLGHTTVSMQSHMTPRLTERHIPPLHQAKQI